MTDGETEKRVQKKERGDYRPGRNVPEEFPQLFWWEILSLPALSERTSPLSFFSLRPSFVWRSRDSRNSPAGCVHFRPPPPPSVKQRPRGQRQGPFLWRKDSGGETDQPTEEGRGELFIVLGAFSFKRLAWALLLQTIRFLIPTPPIIGWAKGKKSESFAKSSCLTSSFLPSNVIRGCKKISERDLRACYKPQSRKKASEQRARGMTRRRWWWWAIAFYCPWEEGEEGIEEEGRR